MLLDRGFFKFLFSPARLIAMDQKPQSNPEKRIKKLPRNVWAVSITSFFMDVSSEMVVNILPLFLTNILGVKPGVIGLIDGVAESTASLLKLFSGWISDKLGKRKWLAVAGYALSALTKPFFYIAGNWGLVAGVRWADRIGKGIRTAPRDALVADSVDQENRGIAFGFHRAMDSAGAMLGIVVAAIVAGLLQKDANQLGLHTFRVIVLISLAPAFLSVLSLAIGAKEMATKEQLKSPNFQIINLGKPFTIFLVIIGVFTLGNSSDSFLVLRSQTLGVSVVGILVMLVMFNLIYSLVSTPAGSLSDRIGRKRLILFGWVAYAIVYLGFAFADQTWHAWVLYVGYGIYYGLGHGTASALVSDLVPENLRGTAYGIYHAVIGVLAMPASLIAGILWEKFTPGAPFFFGGMTAILAAVLMIFWMPKNKNPHQ